MEITNKDFNGKIAALFLFQYSLLIPLMGYVNSTLLVGVTSLFLSAIVLIKNYRSTLRINIIFFVLVLLTILSLKIIFDYSEFIVLIYFIMIAGPTAIVNLFGFDYRTFIDFGIKLAPVSFALLFWYPLVQGYSYMRFGFGMLTIAIFLFVKVVQKNQIEKVSFSSRMIRLIYQVLLLISLAEIFIFGNRGAFFSFMLFWAIDTFLIRKKRVIRNGILLFVAFFVYYNLSSILLVVRKIILAFGIRSHNVTQFINQLEYGFDAASSGRTELYSEAFEEMFIHPIVGNPISIKGEDGYYVHNLFLQVGKDLGLIVLIGLIIFLGYVLIKIFLTKDYDYKIIMAILFGIAIGRLMFNSTLWLRPEFWFLIFVQLGCRKINTKLQHNLSELEITSERYDYGK